MQRNNLFIIQATILYIALFSSSYTSTLIFITLITFHYTILQYDVGGILHVHENVRDTEIPEWVENTKGHFEHLFRAANKPFLVTVRGVEKVKSYAPHVLHIVVDLVCTVLSSE